jgi:hypothetical protein
MLAMPAILSRFSSYEGVGLDKVVAKLLLLGFAALWAKFNVGRDFVSTFGAEFLGYQRRTTLGAELSAADRGTALGARCLDYLVEGLCCGAFARRCVGYLARLFAARSGVHSLHSPRCSFQQLSAHTHWLQRGHCRKCGIACSTAAANAWSCAFSQAVE